MIRLVLAVLLIIAIYLTLKKFLQNTPTKDAIAELNEVKRESARLQVEEEIAMEKKKNSEQREKIESLSKDV